MRKDEVTIKGTKEGLLIILDAESDFSVVMEKLWEKMTQSENFFAGAQAIIDFSGRNIDLEEKEQLQQVIQEQFGIEITKMINQSPEGDQEEEETVNQAVVSGWSRDGNGLGTRRVSLNENIDQVSTLLLKRTLRSGQSVNYDGNVVILGDINPGAEVVASGDIIVMGTFRGVAHAGAKGNEKSIVAAFHLQPTQLRIANIITRSPDEENSAPVQPEIAKIKDGMVIIESQWNFGSQNNVSC